MFLTLNDISEVRAYLDSLVQSGKAPATLVGRIRENVRSGFTERNTDLAQIGFGDVWHAGVNLVEIPLELVPWFRFCRWDLPGELEQRYAQLLADEVRKVKLAARAETLRRQEAAAEAKAAEEARALAGTERGLRR